MLSKKELKFIKSLKVKKYRVRERSFFVEGAKNVLELVNSDYKVELIAGSDRFFDEFSAHIRNVRFEPVKEAVLEQLGTFSTNKDCLAVARSKSLTDEMNLSRQVFALDGISDPGNLGTILRTLDWFGFDQVVCSPDCAEFYNPKVISSTMGSFTRMKVCYTRLLPFLEKANLPVYGAEMEGINIMESGIELPSIVVMGSESHGISREVKEQLTASITIPGKGKAESLNVGVATGIIACRIAAL